MTNAPPSAKPTDDMASAMGLVLEKFLQDIDDMLPARVIAFDRVTNRATVQPLIAVLKTDGTTQSRARIEGVQVFQYSGGGFVINFPLQAGDIGWLKASDRDLTLFKQSFSESTPNTLRKHKFMDAVFFPDVMRGWSISESGLVIQTLSGGQCIAINSDKIKIISDTEVIINAPLTTITGELRSGTESGQAATFGGSITATGEVTTELNGGIDLSSHVHSGVQSGGSNTGAPV
jgi:hypothetical protein